MKEIRNELNERKKRKLLVWRSIALILLLALIWILTHEWILVAIALVVGIIGIIALSKQTPFISPHDVHKKTRKQNSL